MPAGRPPEFETPELMQEKIEEYFSRIEKSSTSATITGLAYFLGFESRQSFYDYEKKEQFSYTVKRARLAIEQVYEQRLHGNSNAGAIFALKNFGWIDSQSFDHTTDGKALTGLIVNVKPEE